jgi:hypothetical protein
MKFITWNRDSGYVLVLPFDNKTSVAVSTKVFKTEHGALKFGERIEQFCGPDYKDNDLPWSTTDIKTGIKTRHFNREVVRTI